MTPALQLSIPPPLQAPPAVRCVGPTLPEPDALGELARELARFFVMRRRALLEALPRAPQVEALGERTLAQVLAGPGVPELDAIMRWHHAHAHLARHVDPVLGRLADDLVTLRCLLRDTEHTTSCSRPGGEPSQALVLAWVTDPAGELEAMLSYTDRAALSFARRGRVPYVYNVWSRARGRGSELLRFVAWQTHGRPITLHPLHEGLAAHYVRAYGAQPAD
jgi:hypothetical protein